MVDDSELAFPTPQPVDAHAHELAHRARGYLEQAKAPNTRRAYRADWHDFEMWCADRELAALPAAPETVALYLADLVERARPATLQRRLSAISQAHQARGHETPTRAAVVRGV